MNHLTYSSVEYVQEGEKEKEKEKEREREREREREEGRSNEHKRGIAFQTPATSRCHNEFKVYSTFLKYVISYSCV